MVDQLFLKHAETCIDGLTGLAHSPPHSPDDNTISPGYYINDQLRAGRVDVCLNHTIGAVCDDDYWGYEDASVVCQQLGFSPYGQSTIMLLLLNITTSLLSA